MFVFCPTSQSSGRFLTDRLTMFRLASWPNMATPFGGVADFSSARSAATGSVANWPEWRDRKSTRLNSSHVAISYAVFCLKKKNMTFQFMNQHEVHHPVGKKIF